jgi:hypothetical protein
VCRRFKAKNRPTIGLTPVDNAPILFRSVGALHPAPLAQYTLDAFRRSPSLLGSGSQQAASVESTTHQIRCTYKKHYASHAIWCLFDVAIDMRPFGSRLEQDYWWEQIAMDVNQLVNNAVRIDQVQHLPGETFYLQSYYLVQVKTIYEHYLRQRQPAIAAA